MLKTLGLLLLIGLAGYAAGVVLGWVGVSLFSTNPRDKELEAAMTSFFFYGPALSILSMIGYLVYRGIRSIG
jgi:F0F1-type ATP synthase membrane subunit c/vacuolar-type H+-ATPase subunit K